MQPFRVPRGFWTVDSTPIWNNKHLYLRKLVISLDYIMFMVITYSCIHFYQYIDRRPTNLLSGFETDELVME